MKHLFRNMLKVLDGKPKRARGQSLVELALTAPILFLMIVSTAEIGFLANNYLILLDAVREGGRFATTLSPMSGWNEARDSRSYYRTACANEQYGFYDMTPGQSPHLSSPHGPPGYAVVGNSNPSKAFFDGAMCQVVAALNPLSFNVTTDDVVVSAVSFINACTGVCVNGQGEPVGTHKIVVTGRWPLRNRYCTDDTRDPFNYDGSLDYAAHPELQPLNTDIRGFATTGKQVNASGCYGSKFHITNDTSDPYNLEAMFNSLSDTRVRDLVPNGAMVIVELTWQHHQLFGFPPLNLLGNPNLYIWMMFPVSAAEPTATVNPVGP